MFHKVNAIAGLNWISFSNGFTFGQVASMIGSLQKREEGMDFSESQISLIASTLTTSALIGFASAAATDKIGRRWPFILFSITTIINWVILYHAKEMYQFILSRIIGGISGGALVSLNIFIPSEYTSPKTRAFFLNMITTAAPAVGTTFAHVIGIYIHWRTVVLIGIFLASFGIVVPYFWVESPHWLASKGKLEDCETAFRKLHGHKPKTVKELQLLIKVETSKLAVPSESSFKGFLLVFKKKYFWKLFIMSLFINAYLIASGKLVFSILATVILEDITGTADVFLFTLLVDAFVILGSCMSCVFIRKTSMRRLLFSTGFTANAILVIFSLCYYFKNGQTYFNWVNVALLAMFFTTSNAGPYPLLEAICSEMFPLQIKLYIYALSGVVLISGLSLSVVLLPYIVSAIGYHGLFLLNASIMSMSLGYVWFMLPETKGKTLQEIEVYFKTRNFDLDEVLSSKQLKTLI